jgi:hypothetical protein
MSKGIYNETYFKNHPEECNLEAVLYCVVLINKSTMLRTCVKLGIAKGKNFKDVIRRANGFKGYEIRIQKIVPGKLENIFYLEQYLQEKWQDYKYTESHVFGGHTELYKTDKLKDILASIPNSC